MAHADLYRAHALGIALEDPIPVARPAARLETYKEKYENLKREASITIGTYSLQTFDAQRKMWRARITAIVLGFVLAGVIVWELMR